MMFCVIALSFAAFFGFFLSTFFQLIVSLGLFEQNLSLFTETVLRKVGKNRLEDSSNVQQIIAIFFDETRADKCRSGRCSFWFPRRTLLRSRPATLIAGSLFSLPTAARPRRDHPQRFCECRLTRNNQIWSIIRDRHSVRQSKSDSK